MDIFGKFRKWGLGTTVFLFAALANIASYLEQSKTPSAVMQMLSTLVSPELLRLVYELLFLFAVAVGFWWLDRRLGAFEERLQKVEDAVPWEKLKPLTAAHEVLTAISGAQGHSTLVIHEAVYGLGPGQDREVTQRVRTLVTNGELHIEVRPETFLIEDPYPNKTKSLRVVCSYGDKERVTIQRTDYQFLNLPLDMEH